MSARSTGDAHSFGKKISEQRRAQLGRGGRQTLRVIAAAALLASIASCAFMGGEGRTYYHSFDFDTNVDAATYGHREVDVLDYAYGTSRSFGTYRGKESKELSASITQGGVTGPMARGEFLYFKWQVRATGQVYEDHVDLRHRLPSDMTNRAIHVVIDDSQLYVFLLPPLEIKDALGRASVVPAPWERRIYFYNGYSAYRKAHQIYPDVANSGL